MKVRRIHSIDRMVALHQGPRVVAVFKSSFAELVDRLLPELSVFERLGFKSLGSFGEFLNKEHLAKLPAWERLFFERLSENIADVGHLLSFDMSDADEIRTYLPDVLESYRGNRIGDFAFFFDSVEGDMPSIVTLQAYDPPSFWQRITKADRPARQRVLVQVGDIKRVVGTSVEFQLETATSTLGLRKDGSIEVVNRS